MIRINNKYTKRKTIRIVFFVLLAVIIFLVGWYSDFYFNPLKNNISSVRVIRENSTEYSFINPLLLVFDGGQVKSPEYKSLTDKINEYVDDQIFKKNADEISVYFRDLNSGMWTGVNENESYSPASMMKVALMVACLKYADENQGFLDKQVTINLGKDNLNVGQFYKPQKTVVNGQTYSVRDLITYMIVYSDNNATAALDYLIGEDKISSLLKELNISEPKSMDSDFISPKLYSRFYRILYNSTYLSPQVSESALKFLSQNDFSNGIRSGVPSNINVSQKFGERTSVDQKSGLGIHELHDCGIVYLPEKPYFLCVMTKGDDFNKLEPILSGISSVVWSTAQNIK